MRIDLKGSLVALHRLAHTPFVGVAMAATAGNADAKYTLRELDLFISPDHLAQAKRRLTEVQTK